MTHILRNAALALLVSSCGPSMEATPAPKCLKLGLPGDGLTTNAPARVTLFFTVDTCEGAPVTGLTADQFTLYEDGNPVSEFESQKTVQPKGQRFRLTSLLLLDLSGSVLRSGGFPSLKESALKYVDQVMGTRSGDGQRMAIYTFDGRASPVPLVDFTSNVASLKAGLERLSTPECARSSDCAGTPDRRSCAGWLCVDDSTNLYGAVVQGLDRLERERTVDREVPFQESALVVFTDGTDQAARITRQAATSAVEASRSHVFTIGLGAEIDQGALQSFGKDGFHSAAQLSELKAAFAEIGAKVSALANRFYLLEYCSPKRSGSHSLELVASWPSPEQGTLKGSISRRFDATGFESGCEVQALGRQ